MDEPQYGLTYLLRQQIDNNNSKKI